MSSPHNSGGIYDIPSVGGSSTFYTSPQNNVYIHLVGKEGGTAFIAWYDSSFTTLKGSAAINVGEKTIFGPMSSNDVLNGNSISVDAKIALDEIYAL